jgi:Tfp pilus assembly protein PilV
LELPEGMYNILDFANSGFSECCWKDGTASKKVTFRWEDVLYVKTTTQSTQENF